MNNQIVIEIQSTDVTTKSGKSARTGKDYSIREQKGYAFFPGKPYPTEVRFALDDNSPAYAQGRYTLHPDSFTVDRFGGLAIGRMKLVSIAQPVKQTA